MAHVALAGGDATLHEVTTADGLVYVSGQLARGTVVDFGTSQLAQGVSLTVVFMLIAWCCVYCWHR